MYVFLIFINDRRWLKEKAVNISILLDRVSSLPQKKTKIRFAHVTVEGTSSTTTDCEEVSQVTTISHLNSKVLNKSYFADKWSISF